MYNNEIPSRAALPSTTQLIRSTFIAALSAVVVLYAVVLPAEYGVDPTGVGRALGLTEMGEIKTRLAQEAAEDAATLKAAPLAPALASSATKAAVTPAIAQTATTPTSANPWRDVTTFTLAPGQGTEIKLKMKEGEKALFSWAVQGGSVNFDTHGDAPGRSIRYEKGRNIASDDGELVAAFTGNHGWFLRNRGNAEVSVVLRTGGAYSDLERMK